MNTTQGRPTTHATWQAHGRTVYAGKIIVALAVSEYDCERPPTYDLCDGIVPDEEGLANARLIAAAPALLAACQQAADLIAIYQARGSQSDRHALNIAASDCRAAISAAQDPQ